MNDSDTDILLATEGTYPFAVGGVSVWADQLVRGLPERRFTLYAVVANPYAVLRYRLPPNVEAVWTVPLWGTESHAEYGRHPGWWARPRRGGDAVRRRFLPAYEALLHALLEPAAAAYADAETALLDLADVAAAGALRAALRRPAVWRLFRDRLLTHPLFRHLSTLEAVDLGRLFYRYLAPLAYPPPRPRLAHASAAAFSALPLIVLKRRWGVPLLLTEHGVYYRERLLALGRLEATTPYRFFLAALYGLVVRLVYRAADRIAPVARFNQAWEEALGVDPARIRPVPNGVDPDQFRIRRPAGSGAAPLTLVQVARLDPLKDQHTALRALALLRKREAAEPALAGIRLTFWGPESDPDYARSCRRLAEELALGDRVTFAGPTADVEAALNQGDIALLSSISEGFPFAAVEALMAGRPLVATAVGGMGEIVAPPYGQLVAPRRPRELARAVLAFARQRRDLARLGELGRAAMVARFSLARFLAAHRALYTELAGPPPAGRGEPHGRTGGPGTAGAGPRF
ncbi:MAG: GT4 family glycosyltransferase PelF [Firmicutes bacterium]|nr:GT4 family glycosyltransferase PelF [Bacillota bacterium]